jgi:hypothetical protein
MRRTRAVLGVVAIVAAAAGAAAAAELQPQMWGWERIFTVSWQPAQHRGQPVIEGYVNNISPYETTQIRVLVDSLDGAGQVTAQRVAWVPGDLGGGGRLFFQVPPPSPAPAYRVRVFSYDRVERDGSFR